MTQAGALVPEMATNSAGNLTTAPRYPDYYATVPVSSVWWSAQDQSVGVRNWGNHFDLNNVCKGTTSWQIKVPNGEYKMKAILPKESHAGCKVQGQSTGGGDGNFEYKKRIKVTDGTVSVSGDFPACHSIASVELTPTGVPLCYDNRICVA